MSFLNFVISLENVFIKTNRIQTILQCLILCNVYNIQVFLNFIRFYKRFIKSYSKVIVLLTNLLRKSIPKTFELNINSFIMFTKVKFLFIRISLLQHFDLTLPLRLKTNISTFVVGAILS